MARLTEQKKKDILNKFHLGWSQNKLAKEFEVSPATINRMCKGLEPKLVNEVNSQIAINSSLAEESECQVNAFDKEVNTRMRRMGLVFGVLENALKKNSEILKDGTVEEKINIGDGMQNFQARKLNPKETKELIDGTVSVGKAFGVIEDKANTTINNTNANQQNNEVVPQFNLTVGPSK